MAAKLCNICGKRRVYTGTGPGVDAAPTGWDGCNFCYTEGSWENAHNDNDHAAILDSLEDVSFEVTSHKTKAEYNAWLKGQKDEIDGCWICFPNLNLAQKATRTSTGPRAQGVRRPQFNHKGHAHPQSPAARRACKTAFWASLTEVKNVSTPEQIAAAQAAWNYTCDAFGKVQAATWTVEPQGHVGTGADKRKAVQPAGAAPVKRTTRKRGTK